MGDVIQFVDAIPTNLLSNPSFETGTSPWTIWQGNSGVAAASNPTSGGLVGSRYGRLTFTTVPTSGGGWIAGTLAAVPLTRYRGYAYLRPSVTLTIQPQWQWYNSGTPTSSVGGAAVVCPANEWTPVPVDGTCPVGSNQVQFRWYIFGSGITTVGQTLDIDDANVIAPTVRLDLNDETTFWTKSFIPSPPRLRRSVAANAMRDGITVGTASYDGRTLGAEVECRKPTQDAWAVEMQKLWRELDRPTNWLMYQPTGATKPVFFRTFRSDTSDLQETIAQAAMRTATVEILAEPFALGLKESIGPLTVNNNPAAASNQNYVDLPAILGDVPAPVVYWDSCSRANTGGRYLASTADPIAPNWQNAEACTLGTDTTNPGGGPDAAMSGTFTNNFVRTTYATNATMTPARLAWTPPTGLVGQWRVLGYVRRTGITSALTARLEPTLRPNTGTTVTIPTTEPVAGTSLSGQRIVVDFGLVNLGLPSGAVGYSSTANTVAVGSLSVYSARTGGTDTLDWDGFLLVQVVDGVQSLVSDAVTGAGATFANVVIDGVTELAWTPTTTADPTTGSTTMTSPGIGFAGGVPYVSPTATVNRLVLTTYDRGTRSQVGDVLTINLAYWPRYLHIRPVTT